MRSSHIVRRLGMAAAIVVLLTACGGTDTVATVDGVPITDDDVLGMRTTYEEADVIDGAVLRDDLDLLIIGEALAVAAAELGLVITEDDIDARINMPPQRWVENFAALQGTPEIGPVRVRNEAKLTIIRDYVIGPLVLAEYGSLDNYVAEAPADVVQICGRHILVASAEEAEAALDRIAEGEDLDALAAELSLAPSPFLTPPDRCPVGVGLLGDEFASAVADAELGVPFGPVATEFGFHVLVLDDRSVPTDQAAFVADATEYMDPGAVGFFFTNWFNDAVRQADIEVASNIGRWSPEGLGIAEPGS